jgi:two-component system, sporulation sensor kinase E
MPVRKFLRKTLEKLNKMDRNQVSAILLRVSEEIDLLEMVLESMTDGLVVTDGKHRIMLLNRAAERLVPLSAEDVQEKLLWEALADKDMAAFLKGKLQEQERVTDKEFTLEAAEPRTLSLSILPLVRDGSIQGNLIHIEDVTDKRSKEARLRRAESLASLTTLAAGVAHEIKNPLGSIGIHLQLIQKKTHGKERIGAKDLGQYLRVISEEVDRLNRIVVDFLFAVKPMDIKLEEGDINQVVKELLDFMRFELEQAGVKLESDLAKSLPMLLMDGRYMKQAILNLVMNAVSAMPKGGTLRIETVRHGDEVRIQVADTGTGIPEEIIGKIFEPYFTTKQFGTGLGLTIVFKIVKAHLGDIAVSSRLAEGSTFTISLPIPQKEKRLIDYRDPVRGGSSCAEGETP